jgi:hypothetical protein
MGKFLLLLVSAAILLNTNPQIAIAQTLDQLHNKKLEGIKKEKDYCNKQYSQIKHEGNGAFGPFIIGIPTRNDSLTRVQVHGFKVENDIVYAFYYGNLYTQEACGWKALARIGEEYTVTSDAKGLFKKEGKELCYYIGNAAYINKKCVNY